MNCTETKVIFWKRQAILTDLDTGNRLPELNPTQHSQSEKSDQKEEVRYKSYLQLKIQHHLKESDHNGPDNFIINLKNELSTDEQEILVQAVKNISKMMLLSYR